MNINWYPGHMLKTKREIIEDLNLIDVVIEILDSRIPISSQNPDIGKIIVNKKHIILLNKSDLADEVQNKKWAKYFNSIGKAAIITDANFGKGINDILKQIEIEVKDDLEKAVSKGITNKKIRIMVIGIPNVGKSSLINRLCNRKSQAVANKPGVTKQKQWVSISNNIDLLDTPGVLWPKFEDEKVALNLAYTGSIRDDVIEKTEVAFSLLEYLYTNYKLNIIDRYKLTKEDIDNIIFDSDDDKNEVIYKLMFLIAKKRGAFLSGGVIDEEKISNILLNDFRSGKLGRITLEKIDEK